MTHTSRDIPVLVFDLDGTLVDSVPDLLSCANRMLERQALPPMEAAELRPMVGDGLRVLVERILRSRGAIPDDGADDGAARAYMADYAVHAADRSRLFSGIVAMLEDALACGFRLAVCTNKPAADARLLLGALGVAPLFDAIGGGDSFPVRKPDPAHVLGTIGLAAGAGGDDRRPPQRRACRARRTHPVHLCRLGYGAAGMQAGADAVLEHLAEVPAVAGRLLDVVRGGA